MSGPRPAMTNIGRMSCVGVAERIAVFLRNSEPSASFADTRRLTCSDNDSAVALMIVSVEHSFFLPAHLLIHLWLLSHASSTHKAREVMDVLTKDKAFHFSFFVFPRSALVACPPYSLLVPLLSVCGYLSEVDDIQLGSERSDFILILFSFLLSFSHKLVKYARGWLVVRVVSSVIKTMHKETSITFVKNKWHKAFLVTLWPHVNKRPLCEGERECHCLHFCPPFSPFYFVSERMSVSDVSFAVWMPVNVVNKNFDVIIIIMQSL